MSKKSFAMMVLALFGLAAMAQQEKKMSLTQALKTAVERNLDIQLQRITYETQAISLERTLAAFEPGVTSTFQTQEFDQKVTLSTQGESGTAFSRQSTSLNSQLNKSENFGFSWNVTLNNSLSEANDRTSLGETYQTTLSFGFTQDLLKGFSFDKEVRRYDEFIAIGNIEASEYDVQVRIIEVLQQTENAYWDLVGAIEDLKVRQQSLELAKQLYEQNKIKIEVGTLASIELVNTEATIAQRETEIVTAENAVRTAEDQLKKVLNLPVDDWVKTIVPQDPLVIEEISPDFKKNLEVALENRPELRKRNKEMENALLTQRFRKNELKPQLQFSGGYQGSGTSSPIPIFGPVTDENGGPVRDEDGEIVIDVIDSIPPSFNEAINEARFFDLPGWQASLSLTWNPFNKQGKTELAQARVDLRRVELDYEKTKLDIMESVRAAGRELESNWKSIQANEKNLKFQRENLRAEVQKFQNGLSTNYQVSEIQNNLAQAESQLNNAKVGFLKALVEFQKAQGLLLEKRGINLK